MNQPNLQRLLTYQPGRPGQSSSFGRDPERGGTWFGFRPAAALVKRIMLAPGETHTLALLEGAGLITRLQMTTLLPYNRHALRDLVLRFYWDGEAQPSVECPFGDFFGAPFGEYRRYVSQPMCLASGAYLSLFPMPYRAGARLEVSNEGPRMVEPFFYNVAYLRLAEDPADGLRFHAAWRRENPTQPGLPYTILDAHGQGHYVGCHLQMQNLEWWLRPPLRDIPFPRGFGMGMMEGWESIYVDGEENPSLVGVGTEDFFNASWYYLPQGAFNAPYHGCTVRDLLRMRFAVYRFDVEYPLPFASSLRVLLDHGFRNQTPADYASTAYWYQVEPHRPYPPLPPAAARKPTPPAVNLAQAALLAAPPLVAGAALLGRLIRGRRRPR